MSVGQSKNARTERHMTKNNLLSHALTIKALLQGLLFSILIDMTWSYCKGSLKVSLVRGLD